MATRPAPPKMNGYSKLASLMGPHPEVALFRRFGSLNARNLMYFQAEIIHLEKQLEQYTQADNESTHPDRQYYDRDWQSLMESGDAAEPVENSAQWKTILKLRQALKEYSM